MSKIIQAMNKAMKQTGLVTKESINSHHRYNFTSEAEVISAIRGPFMDNGLVLVPSNVQVLDCKEAGKTYRYDLLITYKCMHTSGESLDIVVAASGADSQDKALPKAMTMGLKYALIQCLLIARGIDPEKDGDLNEKEVRKWAKQFKGGLEAVQTYCRDHKMKDPLDWPDEEWFERFESAVEEGKIKL